MADMDEAQARVEAAQKALWEAEAEAERVEIAEWNRPVQIQLDLHDRAVERASGLRRAVLELHAPRKAESDGRGRYHLDCNHCHGESHWTHRSFPCPTYELARGWSGDA